MSTPIVIDREAMRALCRRYGVRRLLIFGSAVSGGFDQSRSDVDFLVEFDAEVPSRFEAYFGLKEALEELFGRGVDLVEPAALENPFFAASVARSSQELYAA